MPFTDTSGFEAEDVPHVVEAGGASGDPGGGAQGADGEVSRGGAVGQFQAFAVGGEEDRWSPTMSPPRTAWKPISFSGRSPARPGRPSTATSARGQP